MDIQRQFVQFAGFEVNEYFIFFDLENRGRNFRNVDESFQILCVGYRVGEYDFNSVFRLVDAYGGQEAETVLCRDQNTFVLGTVDACRIAFGGNFQLVIFRLPCYLTDAECVSGRVICLGDFNRIALFFSLPAVSIFSTSSFSLHR